MVSARRLRSSKAVSYKDFTMIKISILLGALLLLTSMMVGCHADADIHGNSSSSILLGR
jgi:hypothetical protein